MLKTYSSQITSIAYCRDRSRSWDQKLQFCPRPCSSCDTSGTGSL